MALAWNCFTSWRLINFDSRLRQLPKRVRSNFAQSTPASLEGVMLVAPQGHQRLRSLSSIDCNESVWTVKACRAQRRPEMTTAASNKIMSTTSLISVCINVSWINKHSA